MDGFPNIRMRRLRRSATLRDMLAETDLSVDRLVAPLFVRSGDGIRTEIPSMPGQYQFDIGEAMETVRRWADAGLRGVLLFGLPDNKDAVGSPAWDDNGPVQQLTRKIKEDLPETLVITDTCLCEYTGHGHCGTLTELPGGRVDVDNDATLESLAKTAVSQARAGAEVVAPSAMMDGQVAAIRRALDEAGLTDTLILSYAVKFASSLYGPFRDAAESAPAHAKLSNRASYQMDPRTCSQAVREARLDAAEGADMLMVKPAAAYLDIIADVRRELGLPLAAYHVSGEYAMLKAAALNGWLDEREAVIEVTRSIRRAGADLVITYYAEQLAKWLAE
ncbi:MAG: porphobilinogen synthase [Phycisphaerae bacterium]